MVSFTVQQDRNPEPPAELLGHKELIEADTIGSTVFSKHWLISTLMKLIKVSRSTLKIRCQNNAFI